MPECEAEGTFVAHVVVSDPDDGRNGRFDCTLDAGHGSDNNFRLTTVGDGEYQLLTAAMLDREESDEYHLSVICEDGGQPPRVSSAELLVQVCCRGVLALLPYHRCRRETARCSVISNSCK